MSPDADPVLATLADLVAAMPRGISWALVGGLAVSARSEPRFTRDVDLAVAVADDPAAEAVAAHLGSLGWTITAFVEQHQVGRLAQVRLRSPQRSGIIGDLLFASSGIESEIAAAAEVLELVAGLRLPVAQVGHLIVLKLLSVDDRRHQDRLDLDALTVVASTEDWTQAEEAVRVITARGFHRGRDLARALTVLRAG